MKKLQRISAAADKAVSYAGIVFFAALIIACVMQVFFRFVLNNSLSWTEELARYCFIWMHMLGACLLIQGGSHATVTVILDLLHGAARRVLDTFIALIILLDGAMMLYGGAMLSYSSRANLSTALRIPMWCVNSSVAVGGLLLVFNAILRIALILTKADKEDEK